MTTLQMLLSNLHGYYVHSIDGMLIDNSTEQNSDDFENLVNCHLKTQPQCHVIERFYSDQSDWYYDFNPNMPILYSSQDGLVLATDIYGEERKLKVVMNLQLTPQVFEKICM